MAGIFDKNIAKVIKQVDPDIPSYLNFDKLRKEGLEHIGQLAGKIWTDHNVHDPGITILEVLIYALMDLGYKTNLPFQDLISLDKPLEKDDNFLTPLQILTVNPVTILDYRKLLLEYPDVRNAWVETNKHLITINSTVLNKDAAGVEGVDNDVLKGEVELNGLYKIYIEKEEHVDDKVLKEKIRLFWTKYRNLCEDLIDIEILKPVQIGVCAEIEIKAGFQASKVYKDILIEVRNFIQPDVKYYTLQELLDKGRTMEDIYAGRPCGTNSFGFVDTEEFEALERRNVIHLSDLYNVILNIEGVRKVKSIRIDGGEEINESSKEWIESNKIGDGEIPVFSLEKTCLDLYSAEGFLNIDKNKIHSTVSFSKKFILSQKKLDSSIPSGKFRSDLSRYYSIQNDFPGVYGIGEDGLTDNVSLTRKTLALQLKGYLLFYDQLLANYTSQLSSIRSLFSLKPEVDRIPEEKQTYFSQIVDTIPGIEKLLKFYQNKEGTISSDRLALPVTNNQKWQNAVEELQINGNAVLSISNHCDKGEGILDSFTFSSSMDRSTYIDQLINAFSNEDYELEVLQDNQGYFFVLRPTLPKDILLVGIKRYREYGLAHNEAAHIAFMASISGNYNLTTVKSDTTKPDKHYFELNYHPVSYLDFIQEITEGEEEYNQRRKKMLDHLLARFGEDFTDYTLLKYRQQVKSEALEEITINDQSIYLSEFAETSRNRGKAFNYMQPSWNTANISGFEKRVSLLAGITNYERRNLCNIEVLPSYELKLRDEKGELLLKGKRVFDSQEARDHESELILEKLRNPSTYKDLKGKLSHFDETKAARIFSEKPFEENIIISKYQHQQQILDRTNTVVLIGKNTNFSSAEIAWEKKVDFIKNINQKSSKESYRLIQVPGKDRYLNLNAFEVEFIKHSYWRWQLKPSHNEEKTLSELAFPSKEAAWKDLVENAEIADFITTNQKAVTWSAPVNDVLNLTANNLYRTDSSAETAWEIALSYSQSTDNYSYEVLDEASFRVFLHVENEVLAVSESIYFDVFDPKSIIEVCAEYFSFRTVEPLFSTFNESYGFQIPGKNSFPTMESFHLYRNPEAALTDLQKAYRLGVSKRNYQEFENSENVFGFQMQLNANVILAQANTTYETDNDRSRALNAGLRFFKKEELPVSLQEQPNKYTWRLPEKFKKLVHSNEEFSSNLKAKENFENTIIEKVAQFEADIFNDHLYKFDVKTSPSGYKFLYGNTNLDGEINPLFISKDTFPSEEDAKIAYGKFVHDLPEMDFRQTQHENGVYDYQVYIDSADKPIAIQYQKADVAEAKDLVNYFRSVYVNKGVQDEIHISEDEHVDREPTYSWRFYKKNDPVAINPFRSREKSSAEELKNAICDLVPPIDLNQCPPKDIVVCPEKDSNKYHYQVSFENKEGLEFSLISYVGYATDKEAFDVWEKEWYQVLQLAKNINEFGPGGKISLEENYKNAEDNACDDASFLVVIPAEIKTKLVESGKDLVSFYTSMARLFPIYQVKTEEKTLYKFKVLIPGIGFEEFDCTEMIDDFPIDEFSSIIWLGTKSYSKYTEAIKAYNHFCVLVRNFQNCRVLCENGDYYVGLIEVLVESFYKYKNEDEAWSNVLTSGNTSEQLHKIGSHVDCLPAGVRSFLYANDDPKNYISVRKDGKWTFKVVESSYFLVKHTCKYNSEAKRNEALTQWKTHLKKLDWKEYMNFIHDKHAMDHEMVEDSESISENYISEQEGNNIAQICKLVFYIRKCLEDRSKNYLSNNDLADAIEIYLIKENGNEAFASSFMKAMRSVEEVIRFVNYFPIYNSDGGYRYRIYWPDNDQKNSENGLQPFGFEECSEDNTKKQMEDEEKTCGQKYPFVSSASFESCEVAIQAFLHMAQLIKKGDYAEELTQHSENGPYSFQIVNTNKELGCHPQYYDNFQEVLDAIQRTQSYTHDMGMHLLEHILLRPEINNDYEVMSYVSNQYHSKEQCLLPIYTDNSCHIDWYPDRDKSNPSAEDDPDVIHYIPGSDPYSFWATLALPSWLKGYRTSEARRAFEQLLYKEAPALVGLNILWLGPKDMCRFEDKYRLWLHWLQKPEAPLCYPDDKHPTCYMVDYINNLKTEMPCSSTTGSSGECNCDNESNVETGTANFQQETERDYFRDVYLLQDEPTNDDSESLEEIRKETLSQISKRTSVYVANSEQLSDNVIKQTKSYEHALSYLKDTPTLEGFVKLVKFFDRYSLKGTTNETDFLELLQNATWHLLDWLVLENMNSIPEKDLEELGKSLDILTKKGLTSKKLYKKWNSKAVIHLIHSKPMEQIEKLLNMTNGK